ncbi:MAG: arsenite methyltransferase [Candidatus Hermodarchaeota archaeon]
MNEEKTTKLDEKQPSSYSCCGSDLTETEDTVRESSIVQIDDVRKKVRYQYAAIAKGEFELENPSITEKPSKEADNYTEYSQDELSSLPEGANLGLGSGNPVALANIQEGETVVDLGSGAGIDCFLAAKKVGDSGKVIGIDMTPQMIDKARDNAREGGYHTVEFRLGEIEHMPLADNSVDLIISNCVINLSPDKSQVFRDAYRVLKPGGRLVISDIVLNHEFPEVVKKALDMPGCVSRAWVTEDYLDVIEAAGFERVELLEADHIQPQRQPVEVGDGLRKRKLRTYNKEIEVILTPEEDERLLNTVMKGHIRAYKPL